MKILAFASEELKMDPEQWARGLAAKPKWPMERGDFGSMSSPEMWELALREKK